MQARRKLKPGQLEVKKLMCQYSSRLVCVRYRDDAERRKRCKTAKIILFAFLTLLFLAGNAVGQTQAPSPKQATPSENAAAPTKKDSTEQELSDAKQQIKLLETQLQVTREYQGSLLNTVYWALGGVFVLVGLLIGFGWFANFKVYERDKEALRTEIIATLEKKTSELHSSIDSRLKIISESVPTIVANSVKGTERALKALVDDVDQRLLRVEIDILKEQMKANPSDNMALTDALKLLEICHSKSLDDVPDILDFMLKTIDKGGKLTAYEITRVNIVIDALPGHYKTLTEKIRSKLVASDIF